MLGTGWGAISFLKSLDPKTYGRERRPPVHRPHVLLGCRAVP